MKFKKSLIFICLILCLLSIASVCASEVNDTIVASEDQNDKIISIENQDNDKISATENDELLAEPGTFTDLNATINGAGDVITLDKNYTYSASDSDFKNGIIINRAITIDGNGYTINGNDQARAFNITATNVILKNIAFINCKATSYGGAIKWYGNDGAVENCNFIKNTATYAEDVYIYGGGAIHWTGANGAVKNCTFTKNNDNDLRMGSGGGAIYWNATDGAVENCTFTDNIAGVYGGAIRWIGNNGTVENCIFTNTTAQLGGAIHWEGNKGAVKNCNFTGNTANGNVPALVINGGGAIRWYGDNGAVENCIFTNNTAKGTDINNYGGAILWAGANGAVENCTLTNNSAYDGGAILWYGANGAVENSILTNNNAKESGGAIKWDSANGAVKNCTLTNNNAEYGGAIQLNENSAVENCIFTNNKASVSGGAILRDGTGTKGTVKNCILTNNTATKNAGAISWTAADGAVENCTLTNNNANNGGAIYWIGKNGAVKNCTLTNNNATNNGGAIYWFGKNGAVKNCTITDNTATNTGGAIYWDENGENGAVKNCTLTNNTAKGTDDLYNGGGAISWNATDGTVENCTFTNNNAKMDGGAINWNGENGTVKNSAFTNNNARYGGAIEWDGDNGAVENCTLTNNNAGSYGGAINWLGEDGTVKNCTLTNNKANDGGAILWSTTDTGAVENCTFTNNNAGDKGGAIRWLAETGVIDKCTFTNNTAYSGGAIHTGAFNNNLNVKNSYFIDNKANSDKLSYVNNTDNLILTFTGNENYINAIYGSNTIIFNNVTYWNGNIVNSDGATPNKSNGEEGFKITIEIYNHEGTLLQNVTCVTNSTGQVIFDYSSLTGGRTYTFKAYHTDDKYYTYIKTEGEFEAGPKADLDLTVSVNNITEGETAVVKVTTYYTFSGNVTIYINDKNYTVDVKEGQGSYNITELTAGKYKVTAKFNGNGKFNPAENTTTFEVKSLIDVIVPQGADTPEFTIKLPSDAKGTLNVTINGKTYTAELVNGSATIKVPGLADGDYNVTISYSGDGKYPPVVKNTNITIKNPVYKITNNKDIKMLYTAKTPYKVLVTKDGKAVGAGEVVTIKFNGKTYNVTTDKNGYATLKLPNVKPKKATYTITATYKGVTVTNKVKVNSIIKAKNKKVKKSKKVTKVKVSLKKVNGKYLKAKKLKIKFNKKTYKVKTNKKGVATWKVKKSMLKKLKVGKKYKYTVTYGKDKVTKKLTIKR